MKKLQIIFITLLIAAVSVSAKNYYVDASSGNYNGSSWSLANNNLQKMVNEAVAGDTIFVAAGVYSGGFVMREGITVIGGCTANKAKDKIRERILPTDATSESQMSILDGGDTQRTLIQITEFTKETVWEGFVIRNGIPTSQEIAAGSLVYTGAEIVAIVYLYDSTTETGKMISIAEAKKAWGGYQVEFDELPYLGKPADDMNGAENTEAIVDKFGETNPDFMDNYTPNGNYAARWCSELSAGGFSDWHLPTAGEWEEIFEQKSQINNILIAAEARLNNGYWTSNHVGELAAWAFYFENGSQLPVLKYAEKSVRAIRSFTASELNAMPPAESSVSLRANGIPNCCIIDDVPGNCEIVGIKNISADFNLQISPNPVKQNENITVVSENKIGHLQLVDVAGKVVFSQNITGNETTITAPESAGVYVLKLENGKTNKIIVY